MFHVGTLKLVFRLRAARSLKDKRRVSAAIRQRVRARFNAAVAEVEAMDDHRRLVVGFAVAGNDPVELRSRLDRLQGFVEAMYLAELFERELHVEPAPGGGAARR